MTQLDRTRWRVAMHLRDELRQLRDVRQRELADATRTPATVTQRIAILSRQLDKAVGRGWHGAARRLREQLRRAREEAMSELELLDRALRRQPAPLPTLRQLVAELGQVEDEFGDWRFDPRDRAVCVSTEPIELEGVDLGRFEIRLMLGDLPTAARRQPYDIVALEPNPAAGSPQVTHPHVADEHLCPGEAAPAINHALSDGRLAEFFMLVRSVLTHYNAGSPYVPLGEWSGEPCTECGDRVSDEQRSVCERCDATVCDQCAESCADCGHIHCPGCLGSCTCCDDRMCVGCLSRCAACERLMCGACLESELCPDCRQPQEEINPDDPDYEENDDPQVHTTSAPTTGGR